MTRRRRVRREGGSPPWGTLSGSTSAREGRGEGEGEACSVARNRVVNDCHRLRKPQRNGLTTRLEDVVLEWMNSPGLPRNPG